MLTVKSTVQKHIRFCLFAISFMLVLPAANAADIEGRIFNFQQKMAKAGNAKAQFKLAYMYETGRGVSSNLDAARQWYKKSVAQNFVAAGHRLTFLDVQKSGFRSKHKAWLKTVISDADNGDDNVMFLLANMYEKGIAVKNDMDKARQYYQRSTAKGNADAETSLFSLEQRMRKSRLAQEKKEKAEAVRRKAEAERLAKKQRQEKLQAQQARLKSQQNKQSKAEKEKQRLIAERNKLAAEKRKLAKLKADLAKKKAAVKAAERETLVADNQEKKSDDVFESDLCTGKAARFRTQCN